MSKSWWCRLGLHKYRSIHDQRFGFSGGIIYLQCKRCAKADEEVHHYFDTFVNATFGYAQLADLDNIEEWFWKQHKAALLSDRRDEK